MVWTCRVENLKGAAEPSIQGTCCAIWMMHNELLGTVMAFLWAGLIRLAAVCGCRRSNYSYVLLGGWSTPTSMRRFRSGSGALEEFPSADYSYSSFPLIFEMLDAHHRRRPPLCHVMHADYTTEDILYNYSLKANMAELNMTVRGIRRKLRTHSFAQIAVCFYWRGSSQLLPLDCSLRGNPSHHSL